MWYLSDPGWPADNRVNGVAVDGVGNKWFATYSGVSRFDGSSWISYTVADGLANPEVNSVAIAGDGDAWFGTQGGVSEFDGSVWTTYT